MANSTFDLLRSQHPTFIYEHFSYERHHDGLRLRFVFSIAPDIVFSPETTIAIPDWQGMAALDDATLERLVFHLGLIEMLSYWKATCAPQIVVRAGSLTDQQLEWWQDLLLHGMREFFYVNDIDFRSPDFVHLSAVGATPSRPPISSPSPLRDQDLVFVSGGKDSTLALQLLHEAGRPFDGLLLNPIPAATTVARQMGIQKQIVVRRTIDPRLLDLNKAGYLNGHTPFSAYLAFLGVTCASLFGYPTVIAANERSSDEGNVRYLDNDVNHQYSKTLRFESAFRQYVRTYLSTTVDYFSLLRPLYALQVSRLFARYPQHFGSFMSCNRGQRDNRWCQHCAKCLSTFILLHPFTPTAELVRIFGADLFAQPGNISLVSDLVEPTEHKPFECVGTREEMLVALQISVRRLQQARQPLPEVLAHVATTILPRHPEASQQVGAVLSAWSDDHHVPSHYAKFLKRQVVSVYETR